MSSKVESGMNTYVGNFHKLINVCEGFGASYNPSPEALKIANLKNQAANIQAAINASDALLPDFITAEGARRTKFNLLQPLSTRVQAATVILNLPDAVTARVKEIVRKIHGKRARAIKPEPENAPEGQEPAKHISVSQVSFNEQIEHLNQLIVILGSQAAYDPAESDLTVPFLNQLLSDMRDTNEAVMKASVPLANARQERDRLLYTPKTGMIDTALAVKEYVKAVFGASSSQYKDVRRIKFENRKL
jgi:hypothetical protein